MNILLEALDNLLDFLTPRQSDRSATADELNSATQIALRRRRLYRKQRKARMKLYIKHWTYSPAHRVLLLEENIRKRA